MLAFWNNKVRPLLDKHPGIVLGIVGLGAIAAAIFGIRSWRSPGPEIATFDAYYTADDGKSLFEDNDPRIPPFDHDGHEAVRAYIIPGRSPRPASIWYLSRMTDGAKARMEEMSNNNNTASPDSAPKAGLGTGGKPPSPSSGVLVKRPGEADWVPMGDPRAMEITKLP